MKIIKSMLKPHIIFIVLFYFSINIIFNFEFWKQVVYPEQLGTITIQGESPIYEYIAETVRLNILDGKNPFSRTQGLLFPLGWNYSIDDISPINGFYFLIFRLFLSIHQSAMLVTVLYIFLANICCYYLLRLLKISKGTSFIMGLVYGFTPFISFRIGSHIPYTAHYVFPLFSIVFLHLNTAKNSGSKAVMAILLALVFNLILLTNLYYFLMLVIIIGFLFFYYLFLDKKNLFVFIKNQHRYLILVVLAAFAFMIPWLSAAHRTILDGLYYKQPKIDDILAFSADFIYFLIPSSFNPFYKNIMNWVLGRIGFTPALFENFVYPGIIILGSFLLAVKMRYRLARKLRPYLGVSVFFFILTLGPYLTVFGKSFGLPLPYFIIHYIPLIQMARAPGRFVVVFIFFSVILAAFFIDYLIKNKYHRHRGLIIVILMTLFFIDQTYLSTPPVKKKIPEKIYRYISRQPDYHGPVLHIPFVVRDGLETFGDSDAVWIVRTQLLHKKPVFSVYAGRLNHTIFRYYSRSPFFKPLAGLFKNAELPKISDSEKLLLSKFINFFDIQYITLKNNERYSKRASNILSSLEFKEILTDDEYSLYFKKSEIMEITEITFTKDEEEMLLTQNWSNKEVGARWIEGRRSRTLFSLRKARPMKLVIRAEAIVRPQIMRIYINGNYSGRLKISNGSTREYHIKLGNFLKKGRNLVTFVFNDTYQLSKYGSDKNDKRFVSLYVKYLRLADINEKN